MTTETLTPNLFATDNVSGTALAAVQRHADFWVGYSGETITGTETADFLHGLTTLLETRGWTSSAYKGDEPELPAPDESLSAKQLVLALWRYIRESMDEDRGPLTLRVAQFQVADQDAGSVAYRVLDALVAARTGTATAQATAWSDRPVRTWGEVRGLLDAAADFARAHGPR